MTPEEKNSFKILVRAYYDCLQERIDLDGMVGIKKDKTIKKNIPERSEELLEGLLSYRDGRVELGEKLFKQIAEIIHKEPLWTDFLDNVKGCGESMSAVILSEFDIEKAGTVSNLWSFAGLNPGMVRGKKKKAGSIVVTDTMVRGDKKTPGFLCPFNQFLRSKLCGVLGSSFLKCKSVPYSIYYYQEKTRLENSDVIVKEHPRKKDLKKDIAPKERAVKWRDAYLDHRHKAAIRKMIKMFLQDLYVAWRTIEGLEVRKPYAEEFLGKKHQKAA
jgi:hypothetical protein